MPMAEKIEERPHLRDCPFCHTAGNDDEKVHFMGNLLIYNGGQYVASYSIFCTGCGVELHDEYKDELVRLWNGEPVAADVEE
jgi:hypothetical protein